MSVIELHVAGADVAVPPKTPSPADSAPRKLEYQIPVSDNPVYQALFADGITTAVVTLNHRSFCRDFGQ
jgi:hypothetical protein